MTDRSDSDLLSVVVLVDQEQTALEALHADLAASLSEKSCEFLYLVTAAAPIAQAAAIDLHQRSPSCVRVLTFATTIGSAAMLRSGLEHARGELVLTVPGEFDVDLKHFHVLQRVIAEGADVAIASRHAWNDRPARIQSRIFSRLLSHAAGMRFGDVTSETRLLRREVIEQLHIYGEFHRYLPVLALRAGFTVREVSMPQHARCSAAKVELPTVYLGRGLDLLSVFFLSRFTRHPLRLFGGVGALLGLLGFGVLLVATIQKIAFGVPLADRPVLVLGTLFLGLGVQAFTIGLLGELVLFVQGRRLRDYRISKIYEASTPPLPARASDTSQGF